MKLNLGTASARDVAAFIYSQLGNVGRYRLQKLAYYCQAWALVWDGRPLFNEVIKAWKDGPVCPELWHADMNLLNAGGSIDSLGTKERETILAVLDVYGRLTEQQLIDLTHRERPWHDARRNLQPSDPGREAITHAAMRDYYGRGIAKTDSKRIPEEVRWGISILLDIPEDRVDDLTKVERIDGEAGLRWLETGERDPWADLTEE